MKGNRSENGFVRMNSENMRNTSQSDMDNAA